MCCGSLGPSSVSKPLRGSLCPDEACCVAPLDDASLCARAPPVCLQSACLGGKPTSRLLGGLRSVPYEQAGFSGSVTSENRIIPVSDSNVLTTPPRPWCKKRSTWFRSSPCS